MTRSRVAELLAQVARIIPGIAGYQDREKRRDADRAVREKAVLEIGRCREHLSRIMDDLSRGGVTGTLQSIGRMERIHGRLERLEDEIRYAPYGYAGWFDRQGVSLGDLERLYEYDLMLLETARRMPELTELAEGDVPDSDWLHNLENELSALRLTFENRTRAMDGSRDE